MLRQMFAGNRTCVKLTMERDGERKAELRMTIELLLNQLIAAPRRDSERR